MAAYCFDCACGRRIEVSAAQAGAEVDCNCGRRPIVPRLGELRALAGEGEFESGAINTIQRMIAEGELPGAATCVVTGFPTNNIAQVHVQCERTWVKGGEGAWAVLLFLILPFGRMLALRQPSDLTLHGRNRAITVPLRIEAETARRLSRAGQRKLRQVMRTVPAYARLLEEYPHARISMETLESAPS